MNKYELVAILDSQLAEDKKEAINNQVTDIVAKGEAKIINNQKWLDKHKMAFRISRCSEGTYYLTKFESAASSLGKIKRNLRLNEDILRFAIYKSE